MKRFLSLVLALALAATAFVGCGESKPGTESGAEGTPAPEVKIESEFFLSEHFDEDGFFKDITSADYVTLPDYKNTVIPKAHHIPGETTVQLEIEQMLSNHATRETLTEGVVEDGDTLNIGYVGTVDGVAFNGGSTGPDGTEVTIGVTQYIDDFLQQLIGHEVGENFDIEVTFPENYGNEQLNGKDAIFNITINSIIETKIPELTDEFCAENFAEEYNTVEKFKAQLTEDLSKELINSYLYTNVFTEAEISEVPAVVSDFVKAYILSTYEMQAMSYGFTLDDYIAQVGFAGRDEFLGYFEADINLFCEDYLIMTAIAEAEGIEATDADVKDYFDKFLGGEDSSIAEDLYGKSYLKFTALQSKVLDYLIENTPREQ
ncbi:MAG: FKBP-type peptidyl-prolyl cis-trans isomerase [Oscillospiraceae bacterium]|nr:FKBP-type peptidyl-prolyl cis-trans isomerase [Oscillospiraceae bacterium]